MDREPTMIEDSHILYKILGYQAVGINKTLSTYAIDDYTRTIDDFSERLASTYVAILFQPYTNKHDYYIHTALKIGTKHFLCISFTNYGTDTTGAKCEVAYMKPEKYSHPITSRVRKDFTFATYTPDVHTCILKCVREAFRDVFSCSAPDIASTIELSSMSHDVCFDTKRVENIIQSHAFPVKEVKIKDEPSLSSYQTCSWKFVLKGVNQNSLILGK